MSGFSLAIDTSVEGARDRRLGVLFARFWKRANAKGAVSSMVAGMLITLAWELAGGPFNMPTVYPALAGSLLCLVAVSLATRPPSESKQRALEQETI